MYRITVRQVVLEAHDVFGPIGLSLAAVMLALLIALVTINHRINAKLWAPFQRSLASMKGFDLRHDAALDLPASGTTEFEELNAVVLDLTDRVRSDYRALKDFTANAAHEMRTPVAAVLNRLEQALQSPQLTEGLATDIAAARSAALRLSKLHQALLVLARIENRHF